jgi:hypothetical protein
MGLLTIHCHQQQDSMLAWLPCFCPLLLVSIFAYIRFFNSNSKIGGSVQIRSSNPLDAPIINPALLADDLDIGTMREAVKSAKRFMAAPAWKGYVLAPFGTLANTNTDAQLDNHIRGASSTIYHPLGSAQMSRKGASYGVVDPDLKVKGIAGLRIVDGSVVVSISQKIWNVHHADVFDLTRSRSNLVVTRKVLVSAIYAQAVANRSLSL